MVNNQWRLLYKSPKPEVIQFPNGRTLWLIQINGGVISDPNYLLLGDDISSGGWMMSSPL